MSNLKHKLEALLFSSARRMNIEELAKHTRKSEEEIREALLELESDYKQRDGSIELVNEGKSWKFNIKNEHIQLVKNVVTQTELNKGLMETLAVIAFRYPIKQSDLIKIRTNKAYGHLSELEELGYITRQKYGRTNLIKLTQKFFEYFDLPPEKLKEAFESFESIAKAIEERERDIIRINEEQKKKAKESKSEDEKIKEIVEVDLVDEGGNEQKLEVYDEEEKKEPEKDKLNDMEVYESKDEDKENDSKDDNEEDEKKELDEDESLEAETEEEKATEEDPEFNQRVDEEVDKMVHPDKYKEDIEDKKSKEETDKEEKTKEKKKADDSMFDEETEEEKENDEDIDDDKPDEEEEIAEEERKIDEGY